MLKISNLHKNMFFFFLTHNEIENILVLRDVEDFDQQKRNSYFYYNIFICH